MTFHLSTSISSYWDAMHHSICRLLRSLLCHIQFYRFLRPSIFHFPSCCSRLFDIDNTKVYLQLHKCPRNSMECRQINLIWALLVVYSREQQLDQAVVRTNKNRDKLLFSLFSPWRCSDRMNDSHSRSKGIRICLVITVNTSTNLDYLVHLFLLVNFVVRHCVSFDNFFLTPKPNLYFYLLNHTQASFWFVVFFSAAFPFTVILETFSVSSHGNHRRVHFVKWNVRCRDFGRRLGGAQQEAIMYPLFTQWIHDSHVAAQILNFFCPRIREKRLNHFLIAISDNPFFFSSRCAFPKHELFQFIWRKVCIVFLSSQNCKKKQSHFVRPNSWCSWIAIESHSQVNHAAKKVKIIKIVCSMLRTWEGKSNIRHISLPKGMASECLTRRLAFTHMFQRFLLLLIA